MDLAQTNGCCARALRLLCAVAFPHFAFLWWCWYVLSFVIPPLFIADCFHFAYFGQDYSLPVFHDYHHTAFTLNYASRFDYWDRLFGTYRVCIFPFAVAVVSAITETIGATCTVRYWCVERGKEKEGYFTPYSSVMCLPPARLARALAKKGY